MGKRLWLFLVCLVCLAGCQTPDDNIPYRKINFTVSIPSTGLVNVGGHEYFTGGVNGIVVYRFDMQTFLAYDRACPHDWQRGGRVEVVQSAYLYDSLCGSMFKILYGMPLSGTAETPLRMYQTYMPDEFTLRVFN
ncbi:MAG: hypothetical protein J6S82_05535 [Bacteroidales bacterium]|nr:hypothetical protein [Bacteroidales bacterium]